MPYVDPLPADPDPEVQILARCFDTRLGSPSHSVPAAAAAADGRRWLAAQRWNADTHGAMAGGGA